MGKCRLFEVLFSIFPLKSWQDFLIRCHFEGCPSCQTKLASVEEIQSVQPPADEMQSRKDFWPEFVRSMKEEKKNGKFIRRPHQQWAYRAVAMISVIIAGAWFVFVTKPDRTSDLPERFRINYIRIEDKPARAYLFQPKDSNMIFVWAEKNTEGE